MSLGVLGIALAAGIVVAGYLTAIGATRVNPRELIASGALREDLYYRLNGLSLHLPPLRERADKGYLIRRIFAELNHERGGRARLRGDAMSALLAYPWPGNIRELHNALRYALATGDGEEVVVGDLPEEYRATVVMSDLHGLRYAEIAGVLGVPEGTVKSRLFRGRRLLQDRLRGYAQEMGYPAWVGDAAVPAAHLLGDPSVGTKSPDDELAAERTTGGPLVPTVSMRQLLEAGVHFGHQTRRWNPKMRRFIFAERNGIHIIDLQKSLRQLELATKLAREVVLRGDNVLFVCTKQQLGQIVVSHSERAGALHVTSRWLGGLLTNFGTAKKQIKRLKELEAGSAEGGDFENYTKKEQLMMSRQRDKLAKNLSGIKNMGRLPGLLFVVDAKKERIAVDEANKLGIPIIAICDTNSDPDLITVPIAGNDDAIRSVELICAAIGDAILDARREAPVREAFGAGFGSLGPLPGPTGGAPVRRPDDPRRRQRGVREVLAHPDRAGPLRQARRQERLA